MLLPLSPEDDDKVASLHGRKSSVVELNDSEATAQDLFQLRRNDSLLVSLGIAADSRLTTSRDVVRPRAKFGLQRWPTMK
jgi:hypothetical protein